MDKPCERIHISGNTLSSLCCGIRLGYEGDGAIRDVVIMDNIIRDTNIGFDVLAILPNRDRCPYTGIYSGAKIENIVVRGMIMRNVRQAFKLWNWTEDEAMLPELEGYIRNVLLSDMFIEAVDASFIGGKSVSGICLENIRMNVVRFKDVYKDAEPVAIPNIWGRGYMKEPLTVFQVPDLKLENVVITESVK
jgi:polygalacturonase